MRLLELSAYFYPEQFASSYLWTNLSEAYAHEGFYRVVCCPTPTRGVDDSVRKEYKKKKDEYLYEGKLNVVRLPMFKEGKNPLFRAIRYSLLSINMFFWAVFSKKAKQCDIIYVGSTPPTQGALAALVKKLKHIPFVYNLQDVFPDSLVGTGLAKKGGLLWKTGRVIENFTYRNADKIIVISQDFKRNIMAKGVPEEKIEVVYNWVDEQTVQPVDDDENELFEEFGISRDKFRVVYAGNLGNAQNIGIVVDAARKLNHNDPSTSSGQVNQRIEFLVFGKGGLEEEIKATKEKEGLENLKILPLQPYERVSKVYGLGHVCIVACKPGLGGAAMPSKTWSIMSSGRAVLANFDEGELKEIVEKNHCGAFTKAGDLEGFVSTIENLSQHPELCAEMGANGRVFILNNLTRAVGTQKYVNVIKSVLKQ